MRRLAMDLAPLRRSRDLRLLVGGQLVSVLGTQMTGVAVAYQVYRVTRSSLDVGLVSLAQLLPLIIGALAGGAAADAADRRRLMLVTTALTAACSAGLAVNAGPSPSLWPLYVLPALAAGLSGFFDAALQAVIPNLVGARDVPAANALFQAVFQLGLVAGPSAAGLLLAGAGIRFVYWIDVASFGAALVAALLLAPHRPDGRTRPAGLRSIAEGFRFARGRQPIQGAYLIDLNATFFGLPRALFPALAATRFGGGAATVGFLYSAPGAGALLGAVTTGWVGRVRRQGLAVIVAVVLWGLAIVGFGLVSWLPAALALLALAGWADVISAVYRSAIIQLSVPDALRGRLMGLQIAMVTGGPRLGDVESGAVAAAFGDTFSVVSGGLACIAGALVLARLLPGFRRQRPAVPHAPSPGEPADAARLSGPRPRALGGLSGGRAAPIVESVLVKVSGEAAEFVRVRGGRLWVWAAHPRMCCSGAPAWMHAATQPPAGLTGFSQVAGDDVQVWFRGVGGLSPDVLEIGLHGGRRPRIEAYWDGCLMAMV